MTRARNQVVPPTQTWPGGSNEAPAVEGGRRTSSAPQSPHPGASSAAGGSPPPAAEGTPESWERFWSIVGGLFAGMVLAGLILWLVMPTLIILAVRVLTS